MTVLEAWAAGVSILGSDRGGIAEWVDEFGGGVLYPAGDHEALAARLQALVDGDITIPVVPSAVRSMSQVASEMIALYSKVGMRNGAHDTYGN
jgi:glycosyltransferase involved in cell wall biosynthesis